MSYLKIIEQKHNMATVWEPTIYYGLSVLKCMKSKLMICTTTKATLSSWLLKLEVEKHKWVECIKENKQWNTIWLFAMRRKKNGAYYSFRKRFTIVVLLVWFFWFFCPVISPWVTIISKTKHEKLKINSCSLLFWGIANGKKNKEEKKCIPSRFG